MCDCLGPLVNNFFLFMLVVIVILLIYYTYKNGKSAALNMFKDEMLMFSDTNTDLKERYL